MTDKITLKLVLHPSKNNATIYANGLRFNDERSPFNRSEQPKGAEKHMLMRLSKMKQISNASAAGNAVIISTNQKMSPEKWAPQAIKIVKEFFGNDKEFELLLEDQRYLTPPVYDDNDRKIEEGVRERNVNIGIPYRPEATV